MTRPTPVMVAVLALVAALAAPVAASTVSLSPTTGEGEVAAGGTFAPRLANNTTETTTTESVPPGAKLAGIVGVQAAELEGEVEQRAFGLRIAAANSNASKAAIVATQTDELESRLTDIRAQQETLRERYQNGSISTAQYKARMATLAAEARTLQRLLNTTADVASALPSDVLRANGVSVSKITTLKTTAANLTGPEVAAIATEIAGAGPGRTPPGLGSSGPPGTASPGSPGGPSAGGTPGATPSGPPVNLTTTPPGSVASGFFGNPGLNVTLGPPGNGIPGNGVPGNGTFGGANGAPGAGVPGNGTAGNATPGNGTPGIGAGAPGEGLPGPSAGTPETAVDPGNVSNGTTDTFLFL